MLRDNILKNKLSAGKTVIGTWSVIPSAVVVDVIASTGLDFIVIDAEHGPISYETAQNMVMACESRGVSPLMRIGGVSESDILKALDIGVHGIHVPNIEDLRDAEAVVRLSKYPPLGQRGFSPFTRAGGYSLENAEVLTPRANENLLNVIHIEGNRAFDHLDSLLSVASIDVIFVGLFDLSKALGRPGQVDHPQVLSYLSRITEEISSVGKYVGTIAVSVDRAKAFADLGVQYITYLVDCDMLRAAYRQVRVEFDANL